MKRPAWKSVNAEIAKKNREEKANKEKFKQKLEEQRRQAPFVNFEPHITYHNCDIVTLRTVCKVDDRDIYGLTFKQRYKFIREMIMQNLTPMLMNYVDIDGYTDRGSHYGSFDEVWEGTIRVVKKEKEF